MTFYRKFGQFAIVEVEHGVGMGGPLYRLVHAPNLGCVPAGKLANPIHLVYQLGQ